ncbi:MAG: anhydro-N-acetylmuramic acid kinase AnmK [Clostridiaceae bacterium]
MYAIGLMSGTSLDGIDAVLCEVHGHSTKTRIKVIAFETFALKEEIKDEIKKVVRNDSPVTDLMTSLNFKLGYEFSKAVKNIIQKAGLKSEDIAFVASHGQTLYHLPKDKGNLVRSTLQMGEPAIIAYENDLMVISNFRAMDVAAGGEGAPLVPFSEIILYGEEGKNIALQNIGGIGNVTLLPGNKDSSFVFAFDTGPGNMMIDEAMKVLYGKNYDEDGKTALSGTINEEMLRFLLTHPYLELNLPKSTGREDFGEEYTTGILKRFNELKPEDIIATLTMFTAQTINDSYRRFIMDEYALSKVIIGGGGAHNKTLLGNLRELMPEVQILTQEDLGMSSDAKEAVAFVVLGNETYHRSFSNVPGATGAKEQVILGSITLAPKRFDQKGESKWL